MTELVPNLVTSHFDPIWDEVNISQALAASKQQELLFCVEGGKAHWQQPASSRCI